MPTLYLPVEVEESWKLRQDLWWTLCESCQFAMRVEVDDWVRPVCTLVKRGIGENDDEDGKPSYCPLLTAEEVARKNDG